MGKKKRRRKAAKRLALWLQEMRVNISAMWDASKEVDAACREGGPLAGLISDWRLIFEISHALEAADSAACTAMLNLKGPELSSPVRASE